MRWHQAHIQHCGCKGARATEASPYASQKVPDIQPFSAGGSCLPLDADVSTRSTGDSYGLLVPIHRGEKGVAVVTCLRRRCSHCTTPVRQGLKASPCRPTAFRSGRCRWPDQRAVSPHAASMACPCSTHAWPWRRNSRCSLDGIDHLSVFAGSKAEQPLNCHRGGSSPASLLAAC